MNTLENSALYVRKSEVYRGIHYFSNFGSNRDSRYLLESPQGGSTYKYPQSMFGAKIRKTSQIIDPKMTFLRQ